MEVKEILLEAAELINLREEDWMCEAIKEITELEFISKEISKYGFTKENYEKFIRKNYPELEECLFEQSDGYRGPWIDTMTPSTRNIVLQSKVEFLKYLANGN